MLPSSLTESIEAPDAGGLTHNAAFGRGHELLAVGAGTEIEVWDWRAGSLQPVWRASTQQTIASLSLSLDGALLVAGTESGHNGALLLISAAASLTGADVSSPARLGISAGVSSQGSFFDGKLPICYRGRDGGQCWRNVVRAVDCWKLVENDGSTFASWRDEYQAATLPTGIAGAHERHKPANGRTARRGDR
jgi:hypothetical protein